MLVGEGGRRQEMEVYHENMRFLWTHAGKLGDAERYGFFPETAYAPDLFPLYFHWNGFLHVEAH